MTPLEQLLRNVLGIDVWLVVKIFVVFALGLYLVFAMVMIRQVQLMSKALNGTLDLPLRMVVLVHFGIALLVFVLAIFLL